MGWFSDLLGTTSTTLQIGTANIIKQITGGFAVRNVADNADGKVQASTVEVSEDDILINYDAASSGNDWTLTLARNPAQTAPLTVQFPLAKGTDGYALRQKAGTASNVIELELAAVGTTSQCVSVDTTSIAHGSAATIPLFTSPSGAVAHKFELIVDESYNATPTLTIGIAGNTSKYMTASQNVLTAAAGTGYETNPKLPATAGEDLIATYSAGGATAGAARILVHYSVPS